MFSFFHLAALVLMIACAVGLFYLGYNGYYWKQFFFAIVMHVVFAGALWFLVKDLIEVKVVHLVIGGGLAVVWPLLGAIWFNGRNRREQKQFQKEIVSGQEAAARQLAQEKAERQRAIQKERESVEKVKVLIENGRKNQAFQAFVRENGERIGMISKSGVVRYAPEGVPMFKEPQGGDFIHADWSDELGDPVDTMRFSAHRYQWLQKSFFEPEEGERSWTEEEKVAISWIIEESLPGGAEHWLGVSLIRSLDRGNLVKNEINNIDGKKAFTRRLKEPIDRVNLKNPY